MKLKARLEAIDKKIVESFYYFFFVRYLDIILSMLCGRVLHCLLPDIIVMLFCGLQTLSLSLLICNDEWSLSPKSTAL